MNILYKYRTDYATRYRTFAHFVLFAAVAGALCLYYDGGYVLAWFVSIIVAIIALMMLSIPRRLTLSEEGVEIGCVYDHTHIPYEDIASIKAVSTKEMNLFIPIFASAGFFGYFGCYLNLRKLDIVKIYASKWNNFIEITDIYEEKFYISCDNGEEFISLVEGRITNNRSDE